MLHLPVLPLLLSPFIGSFLGVLAARLPRRLPVALARSACPRCGAVLRPRELVPVVSYLVQKGRCRSCGGAISAGHPAMEVAALLVAGLVLLAAGPLRAGTPAPLLVVWSGCLFGWWLLVLAAIDLKSFRLPDTLTVPLIAAGLGLAALGGAAPVLWHALAAAAGYGVFRGISLLYRRARGHDGLGGGDAKLLAAGGAWLGPESLPHVVFLGAVLTLCAVAIARRGDVNRTLMVPFGPGLALAMWGIWLWQASLLRPDWLPA
ncbi:peptidase A24A domain protein [Gluconacetobacter diazotrophicus PA1 5]|uniref:Prepilin leader peptidase/N-methyltransferase n=2 Tax=Gluconacetobacter diazotrophicus TaxID=33996 RepID=A9H675_GLUDA|nr:A24 family peptidase [Gluconacetobacter diazotrophicus]AAK58497.1 prepilin peptidase and N-methyltransferase O [Gluconacetobacter diazotrophicus]ACI51306.1 peptidase A24A domain protein [Gluconacetobacter diazotrophicus PA1 5]MBB2154991.1 prepilin peptidase [Gluconacetobacter diazotrophicus]TWB09854.1 type 4 prepilin peptidase 1 [Gluconacetobacter diazotrophicus]CAP54423.1 putative prepilin peptidase and N-methyltransferase O [Gluconacetobacter diazotrophicus PA1 5]